MNSLPWKDKVDRLQQRLVACKCNELLSPERTHSEMVCKKLKEYIESKTNQTHSLHNLNVINKITDLRSWSLVDRKENRVDCETNKWLTLTKKGEELCFGREKFLENDQPVPPSLLNLVATDLIQGEPKESIIRSINYSDYAKYGDDGQLVDEHNLRDETLSNSTSSTCTIRPHTSYSFFSDDTLSDADNATYLDETHNDADLSQTRYENASIKRSGSTTNLTYDRDLADSIGQKCKEDQTHVDSERSCAEMHGGSGDCRTPVSRNDQMHKSQSECNTLNEFLVDNENRIKELTRQSLNTIKSEIKVLEELLANK